MTGGLRGVYVAGVQGARRAAETSGLLGWLSRSQSPRLRHLRTLFAIHDAAELARLDLAWWSYPAMRRVEEFLATRTNPRVFEFGAGASTLWLARRAGEVHSVEHDPAFAERVRELLASEDIGRAGVHAVAPTPATATTTVRSGRRGHRDLDFADYVATIDRVGGTFDLVVVDGRARVDSFNRALEHLAPGGLVVFDNIRRRRYREVPRRPGLRVELLRGATPALPYPTTTGLISRA